VYCALRKHLIDILSKKIRKKGIFAVTITEGCRLLFGLQPSVSVLLILKRNSVQSEFQEIAYRLQRGILPTGHISAKVVYPGGF
jgi:hypothetical protein